MLVLSRRIGEVITIGNSVKITIIGFDRGVVRLGIDAPKSIAVHRKEIFDHIQGDQTDPNSPDELELSEDIINQIEESSMNIYTDEAFIPEQPIKVPKKRIPRNY